MKSARGFNNHFKSKFALTPEERTAGDKLRNLQAKAVATIIHERFPDNHCDEGLFVVLGDLNDEWLSKRMEPLRDLGLENILERRGVGFARYLQDGKTGPNVTRLEQVEDDPNPVELDFQFKRFKEVTPDTWASDHCPLMFDLDV
jgi:endonuclease/exonuclease/phosphatase family metal-dependent hydrolase